MKEKFKKFREGLSLEQVKKIIKRFTIVSLIFMSIVTIWAWNSLTDVAVAERFLFCMAFFAILSAVYANIKTSLYGFLGGPQKECKIQQEETKERVKEKFGLNSEDTEIFIAKSISKDSLIIKIMLEAEQKAEIRYFVRMSENEKYFIITAKLGDRDVVNEIQIYNWHFLEKNFEPKK